MDVHADTNVKYKIMIVDDSTSFIEVALRLISRYPKFSVSDIAFSADEGLVLTTKKEPDVILLDIEMPEKSGLDTIQQFKELVPGVKIIILTLFDNPIYRAKATQNGADGFISKRDFVRELIPALEQCLEISNLG